MALHERPADVPQRSLQTGPARTDHHLSPARQARRRERPAAGRRAVPRRRHALQSDMGRLVPWHEPRRDQRARPAGGRPARPHPHARRPRASWREGGDRPPVRGGAAQRHRNGAGRRRPPLARHPCARAADPRPLSRRPHRRELQRPHLPAAHRRAGARARLP